MYRHSGENVAAGEPIVTITATHSDRIRAFILPGVPAANSEASVVLPTGHYQSGKEFQIADEIDELSFIRLKSVVERGIDFDRISYETI